jgi:uncharacterized protein HemX
MEPLDSKSPAPAPRQRSTTVTALAVVVVAMLLAAAYLWRELADARQTARERERTVFQLAESDHAALRTELGAEQRALRELSARADALERELAALRSRTEQGRASFAMAEARHLVRLANEQLHLARDPVRAAAALRAADARLAALGDASTAAARAEIARGIAALDALPRTDPTGLALALLTLGEKAQRLPLRTRLPDAAPAAPPEAAAPASAWDHFVERVQLAFRGLITVRRAPGGAEPLLAPDQEWFLRRNLELKLETARLAALARDGAAFRSSTRAARDWLAVYFDPAAVEVRTAVADLDAMQRIELAPPLPDLTRALTLLEQRGGG